MLKAPSDLFCRIEARLKENPELLTLDEYHLMPDGDEAFLEPDIMHYKTAHCLAGWIIAMTPNAARLERMRTDVDEYAQQILVASGRPRIPTAILFSDAESVLKIIRGRAAEERAMNGT